MLGMEMMLSNMIGMKPDELQEAVRGVINAIHSASENMKQINARLERIENRLEEKANGGSNGTDCRNSLPPPSHSNSEHIQL